MPTGHLIHVADAVRFLAAFSPAELDQLRLDNSDPSALAVLEPDGAVLGDDAAVLDAAVAAAEAFLAAIDRALVSAIRSMRRKLNLAQWIELAGKLLALGSAATLMAVLVRSADLLGDRPEAIALAAISFLSAAIPLIVSFMRGSITDPSGLQKNYTALKEASIEAALLRSELAIARNATPRDRTGLTAMVDAVNDLARRTLSILTDLGHDIRPGVGGD